MKYILFYFIGCVLLIACDVKKENTSHILQKDSAQHSIKEASILLNWPDGIRNKLKDAEHLFAARDIRQYDCSVIEKYYVDNGIKLYTNGLIAVDVKLCSLLFGTYANDYGNFCNSYLYSIEQPIQNFYPITVIQQFGTVERPMIMILYNAQGDIVNSFEVADLYGEAGGCLRSYFTNDSTLIQNFQWDNFGIDTLTQQEIYESEYMTQELIISKSGKVSLKELKRSKEIKK